MPWVAIQAFLSGALAKKLILSPNGRDLEYPGWLPCYGTLSEFA